MSLSRFARRAFAEWDPEEHPRGEGGRFTEKTYEFLVDYAADKDSMDKVAGSAHVRVVAKDPVEARLVAEQMVAARGVEPVAAEEVKQETLDPVTADAMKAWVLGQMTEAGVGMRAIREEAEAAATEGRPATGEADALLAAIDAAPPLDRDVHRGFVLDAAPDEAAAQFAPGREISIPLASASFDPDQADRFAQWGLTGEWEPPYPPKTEVLLTIEGAKGLPVDYDVVQPDRKPDDTFYTQEQEVIIGGRYIVDSVTPTMKPDYYGEDVPDHPAIEVRLRPADRTAAVVLVGDVLTGLEAFAEIRATMPRHAFVPWDPEEHPRGEGGRFTLKEDGGEDRASLRAERADLVQQIDDIYHYGDEDALAGHIAELTKRIDEIDATLPPAEPNAAVTKMMETLADPDSGMTISRDGDVPTTGYIVAVEGHSETIPAAEFTGNREAAVDFVDTYLAEHADALDEPGMMLGLWHDPESGNIFFDVVEHVPDREEAIRLGAERDQIAIFDLANLDVVPTGGTGGLPDSGPVEAPQASVGDDRRRTARVRGTPGRPDPVSRFARRAFIPWDPEDHPRGEGGRFVRVEDDGLSATTPLTQEERDAFVRARQEHGEFMVNAVNNRLVMDRSRFRLAQIGFLQENEQGTYVTARSEGGGPLVRIPLTSDMFVRSDNPPWIEFDRGVFGQVGASAIEGTGGLSPSSGTNITPDEWTTVNTAMRADELIPGSPTIPGYEDYRISGVSTRTVNGERGVGVAALSDADGTRVDAFVPLGPQHFTDQGLVDGSKLAVDVFAAVGNEIENGNFQDVADYTPRTTVESAALDRAMGDAEQILQSALPEDFNGRLDARGGTGTFMITDADGYGGNISFDVVGDRLHISSMVFDPEVQDRGLGTAMVGAVISAAEQMNVSSVEFLANITVGGYAWARMGAYPTEGSWETVSNVVSMRAGSLVGSMTIDEETYAQVIALASGDRRGLPDIAALDQKITLTPAARDLLPHNIRTDENGDIELGKALLIGSSWNAQIPIGDQAAREEFEQYTAEKAAEKEAVAAAVDKPDGVGAYRRHDGTLDDWTFWAEVLNDETLKPPDRRAAALAAFDRGLMTLREAMLAYAFVEEEHPRGEGGRFTFKDEPSDVAARHDWADPTAQLNAAVDRIEAVLPGALVRVNHRITEHAGTEHDPRVTYVKPQDYADAVNGVATGFERMAADYPDIAARIGTVELGPTDSGKALGQYLHQGSGKKFGDEGELAPPGAYGGQPRPLIQIDIDKIVDSHALAYRSPNVTVVTHTIPAARADASIERLTEGIATHEFGHAVYYAAPSSVQMHSTAYDAWSKSQFDDHISNYAGANQHEYFAEAFTANELGMGDRLTDQDRNMLRAAGVDVTPIARAAAATVEIEDPPPDTFEGSIVWEYARDGARAAAVRLAYAEFREEDHPRGQGGKFARKDGEAPRADEAMGGDAGATSDAQRTLVHLRSSMPNLRKVWFDSDVPDEAVNATIGRLHGLAADYPEVAAAVTTLTVTDDPGFAGMTEGAMDGKQGIGLNFSTRGITEDALGPDDPMYGKTVNGTREGLIDHEFGHAVHLAAAAVVNGEPTTNRNVMEGMYESLGKTTDPLWKTLQGLGGTMDNPGLSQYAYANIFETFAETFGASRMPEYADREDVQTVVSLVAGQARLTPRLGALGQVPLPKNPPPGDFVLADTADGPVYSRAEIERRRARTAAFDETKWEREHGRFHRYVGPDPTEKWVDDASEGSRVRQVEPRSVSDSRARYGTEGMVRARLQAAFPNAEITYAAGWTDTFAENTAWMNEEGSGVTPGSEAWNEEVSIAEANADRVVAVYDALEQMAEQFPEAAARVTGLDMIGRYLDNRADAETRVQPGGARMIFSQDEIMDRQDGSDFNVAGREGLDQNDLRYWSFGVAVHEFGHVLDNHAAAVEHGREFTGDDFRDYMRGEGPRIITAWEEPYPDHFDLVSGEVSWYAASEPAEYAAEAFALSRLDPYALDDDTRQIVEWIEQRAALPVASTRVPVAASMSTETESDGTHVIVFNDVLNVDCVPVQYALGEIGARTAAIGGPAEIIREIPDKFVTDAHAEPAAWTDTDDGGSRGTVEPRRPPSSRQAYAFNEEEHPRGEHGRFTLKEGIAEVVNKAMSMMPTSEDRRAAATERIVAALPTYTRQYLGGEPEEVPATVDLDHMDPDHAELLAQRVERFTEAFPDVPLTRIIVEPPGPGTEVGRNLGVYGNGAIHLNGDPRYYGEMPPPPVQPDSPTLRPDDREMATYRREQMQWANLESAHERFARWTDNEGKASGRVGQTTFHPVDGAQATIDHELGHAAYHHAETTTGWYGGFTLTQWALGRNPQAAWDQRPGEPDPPGVPVRQITRWMRETGTDYGARSFTSPERGWSGSAGPPSHDLNEGFADWFAMHQAGLPTEARTPPELEAAFQRIVSAAKGDVDNLTRDALSQTRREEQVRAAAMPVEDHTCEGFIPTWEWDALTPEEQAALIPQAEDPALLAAGFVEEEHPRESTGTGRFTFKDAGASPPAEDWATTAPIPPEPGTAPIPDGYVRLYHYTRLPEDDRPLEDRVHAAAESLRTGGLRLGEALGDTYGEPNMVWASAQKPSDDAVYAEFAVPMGDARWIVGDPMEISPDSTYEGKYVAPDGRAYNVSPQYYEQRGSNVAFNADIRPEEILAVHEPWHDAYRYFHETPEALASARSGQYDDLKDDPRYGPALRRIQAESVPTEPEPRQAASTFVEEEHPRDAAGRWTSGYGTVFIDRDETADAEAQMRRRLDAWAADDPKGTMYSSMNHDELALARSSGLFGTPARGLWVSNNPSTEYLKGDHDVMVALHVDPKDMKAGGHGGDFNIRQIPADRIVDLLDTRTAAVSRFARRAYAFVEEEHPRGEHGKFTFKEDAGRETSRLSPQEDAIRRFVMRGAGSEMAYAALYASRGMTREEWIHREGNKQSAGADYDAMRTLMDAIPGAPREPVLYRGIIDLAGDKRGDVPLRIGDTYQEPLASWSTERELADQFREGHWSAVSSRPTSAVTVEVHDAPGIEAGLVDPRERISGGTYRVTAVEPVGTLDIESRWHPSFVGKPGPWYPDTERDGKTFYSGVPAYNVTVEWSPTETSARTAGFVEEEHPRDEGGKFADKSDGEEDYRGLHQAPDRSGFEDGSTAQMSDLTTLFPDDIYGPNGAQYYGHGGDAEGRRMDEQTLAIIRSVRDRPDAEITMYRAAPDSATSINPGDWVTPNRAYAEQHMAGEKGWHIIAQTARAGDLFWDGNSIHEFGWDPEPRSASAERYGDAGMVGQTLVRPEPREAAARERSKSPQQIMAGQIRSARRLRDRLATAKRDTVRQLAAGAEIAFAEALRHAGVRAISKARNKQSKAAAVTVASAFDAHQSLAPFFAALGVNEQQLLHGSFAAYQEQVAKWLDEYRREQRRIAEDEGWGDEADDIVAGDDDTDHTAAIFLGAALFALAASRLLAGDDPTQEPKGEISGVVPTGLVLRALDVASGGAHVTLGESRTEMPRLVPLDKVDVERLIAEGLRDRLRDSLTAELRGRQESDRDASAVERALAELDDEPPLTEYVWAHGFYGEPKTRFDPHFELDGTRTTDPETDERFRNDGDWPDGDYYFPGDHLGCSCELVAQVPSALDSFVDAVA